MAVLDWEADQRHIQDILKKLSDSVDFGVKDESNIILKIFSLESQIDLVPFIDCTEKVK